MNCKRRKQFLVMVFLLLLIGLPAWWLNQEIRQERDNRVLIATIMRNDTSAVLAPLRRGADPSARDLGNVKSSSAY